MNQCPVCRKYICEKDKGLCHKCGWDINYYANGMTRFEELRFKKKLNIARRNWKILVSSVLEKRALKKQLDLS
ncbi:MAG: hypothetical protein OMM_06884 [Candidatus Magnetoglobus multicellularis str. Araruama]|uniref:Uncharacterized protein n=1 Tax=Candidatus Magnetoglobus multicellularis str. Araruama TaxID=890399 RepID=A0A1V1PFD3_9BACT|nr:MAG: hypothetical protein OMM_06884 [Candidatus Magnetoglobus multicellularis str. Araruama]